MTAVADDEDGVDDELLPDDGDKVGGGVPNIDPCLDSSFPAALATVVGVCSRFSDDGWAASPETIR